MQEYVIRQLLLGVNLVVHSLTSDTGGHERTDIKSKLLPQNILNAKIRAVHAAYEVPDGLLVHSSE